MATIYIIRVKEYYLLYSYSKQGHIYCLLSYQQYPNTDIIKAFKQVRGSVQEVGAGPLQWWNMGYKKGGGRHSEENR